MRPFAVLLMALIYCASSSQDQLNGLSKVMKGRLTEKSFMVVKNIHVNWYIHAIKALMGQLGKQLLKKLTKEERKVLLHCLDEIEDEKDLVYGARCLSQARKLAGLSYVAFDDSDIAFLQDKANELVEMRTINGGELSINKYNETTTSFPNLDFKHRSVVRHSLSKLKKLLAKALFEEAMKEIREESLLAQTDKKNISAGLHRIDIRLSEIQKMRIIKRKNLKKLDISKLFPTTVTDTKWLGYRKRRSSKESDIVTMEKLNFLNDPKTMQTPIQKMTKLIRALTNESSLESSWMEAYKKLLKFRQNMDEKQNLPGAKIYKYRMYDIVTDKKKPTRSSKNTKSFPDFLTMTYQLVSALSRKHRPSEETNFRFLSPRIAPLMPEKIPEKQRFLSPSLLSFYKDESPDNIASLPKILEKSGLREEDRDAIMELLMDVSGASKAVSMSLEVLQNINFFGMEGELFEVTKKLDTLFRKLDRSFNKEQKNDIDLKGFTFLEKHQIEDLLKGHHVKDPKDVGIDLEEYGRLNAQQKYDALWERIEAIAKNVTDKERRQKRQVLMPTVLAPYMFAPVSGHSVLGPVVLSPSIFSPLILNPALLGPFVLSPAIGMPFILSPYVLTPYVLSPLVMAPFVLSPYILSPNVINPYVLSPIILSPYVLSPDILSPATLGGPILSPSVLSPPVLTETVMMANVLSPSFLS